ncbi:MAG: DUF817 domain-containing protein [Planctomycetaceae bacterium]|nr:DUF817 domain-containing protein [Planctomycetaceae bacterium]
MRAGLREFLIFGVKEARACIFAGTFLALLLLSRQLPLGDLPRYDFLFLAAVLLQVVLLATRVKTLDEVLVLCAFHAVGMGLELFKTSPAVGSWSYPEPAFFKLGTVPLYSGFMYAAVASYMCQAWRIFRLELRDYPSYWLSAPLAAAIYGNFFAHHYGPDLRWWLIGAVFVVFGRTTVCFTVTEPRRRMPLVLSFALIGFFIWVAENIATFFGAWVYPQQSHAWQPVDWRIMSSWFLLTIISFILVADLKHVRERMRG